MNIGRCTSCGASVLWSKTIGGKKVSLNPIPVHVALGDVSEEDRPVAIRQAHTIHLTTCAKRDTRIRR